MTGWLSVQNAASSARRALAADFKRQGDDLIGVFGTGAELNNEQALCNWLRGRSSLCRAGPASLNRHSAFTIGFREFVFALADTPGEREIPLIDFQAAFAHPHALGEHERLIIARALQCLLQCRAQHREAAAFFARRHGQCAPLLDHLLDWLRLEDPHYADFPAELTLPLLQRLVLQLETTRNEQAVARGVLHRYTNVYTLRPLWNKPLRNDPPQQRYRGPWYGWDCLIGRGKRYVRVPLQLIESLALEPPHLMPRASVLEETGDCFQDPNTDVAVSTGWLADTALTWLRRVEVDRETRRRIGAGPHTEWLAILAIAEALKDCLPAYRSQWLAETLVLPTGETALALLNAGQPGKLLRHLQRFGLARRW